MPTNASQSKGTKLFHQDIVQKVSSPDYYGIVLRCWHDSDDLPPEILRLDPLMRPLAYGEAGVTFISHKGERQILRESELQLLDRTLQSGDYCKRSFDDVRAGVVTNIKVKARVAHAISAEKVDGWRTLEDIDDRADAQIGDYIVYDDWIGQIIEVFDESIVEVLTGQAGQLVRLPELGSRLAVGETGVDVLPPPLIGAQTVFRSPQENNEKKDVVVAVKHTVYAIAWLAVNQLLNATVAENKSRPHRFWFGQDLGKLTLVRGLSDMEMRVGDRLFLKDAKGLPMTQHGQVGDATGVLNVQTFLVSQTSTELNVLWQDGSKEILKSTEVIPYLNPDEYDCWPGEHVMWKNEGETRPVIVQSVNATQRTALILLPDTGAIELASLLELDPHGHSDYDPTNPTASPDGFGVRRGDFVLIHAPGSSNGMEKPRVPRIGEIEPWVRESPSPVVEYSGWRKELQELGSTIAAKRSAEFPQEKMIQRPAKGDGKILWCGEVTGLNMDGSVEVTRPDWTVATYPLERLTRLYDGIEQLEEEGFDAGSDDGHSRGEDEETWAMDEDGNWQQETQDSSEWEDVSMQDVQNDDINEINEGLVKMDNIILPSEAAQTETEEPGVPANTSEPSGCSEGRTVSEVVRNQQYGPTEGIEWKRFEILSSAPPDHAFFSSPPAQPSRAFLGRLSKEYRVLTSSLPDSILVRAYEDRTDLLRCLIIGPENTPYQDAPFVIDWMLDSNFPHSPPIAHFLSWTNGNGRVNPNLYEEGKVCLSILGTWTGDKHEVWSASRSSLLQAFVSIQGLVLVKEPWFCEPAYDKLRGTEEGIVNSRLYSEKAFVLSRGFVRRALEIPLGGLESEITYLYHTQGRLQKVVTDAESLIQKSRDSPNIAQEDQDLAIPRLTGGGIIALERILTKLRHHIQATPS